MSLNQKESRVRRMLRFLRRPLSDHCLWLEALFWLAWIKFLLLVTPFRMLAPRLGRPSFETTYEMKTEDLAVVQSVGWAVQAVARHVPLGFVCLPQAIAGKWMLRRRGLASTLYLGARHGENTSMTAHAWLRAGNRTLTGYADSFGYTVIATFAE